MFKATGFITGLTAFAVIALFAFCPPAAKAQGNMDDFGNMPPMAAPGTNNVLDKAPTPLLQPPSTTAGNNNGAPAGHIEKHDFSDIYTQMTNDNADSAQENDEQADDDMSDDLGLPMPDARATAAHQSRKHKKNRNSDKDNNGGGMAVVSNLEETDPPLRMMPDKTQIIDFKRDIGRIIIGNDTTANIVMDSTRRILVIPRAEGATHFTILDNRGHVMMQRHVIVAGPEQQYVRIRRNCSGTRGCEATTIYYCPDTCHQVELNSGTGSSGGATANSVQSASHAAGNIGASVGSAAGGGIPMVP